MAPGTRSSSRLAAVKPTPSSTAESAQPSVGLGGMKRKSTSAATAPVEKKVKKSRTKAGTAVQEASAQEAPDTLTTPQAPSGPPSVEHAEDLGRNDTPVPAVLTFDFEKAQEHLISIDPRFQDLFDKMPCRPFEQLEQVHPFRALTISILGQQISWKAARSITHKFIRLYDPSIPEQVTDESREQAMDAFPSPQKVATTELAVLRTAGLSARKAEYVLDLAKRFADGRLSTEKLRSATDEELAKMLIEVKGIGQWTVDMFAIFSLRRPDILPVGDLGVQRGLVRWFLSQHSAAHPYALSPEKVGGVSGKAKEKSQTTAALSADKDTLPGAGDAVNMPTECREEDVMESVVGETALLPTPFTPSIKQTLKKTLTEVVPLPAGLTVSILKGRLDGKKIKGAFLTPQEMTDLTEHWRPYRSLGVYYMWSLASPSE